MNKIVYINDTRRPERNKEFIEVIENLGYKDLFIFIENVKDLATINTIAGVVCHSGMEGYNIVIHFQKIHTWPLLAYSGSVNSTPYLRSNKLAENQFSVDSDYFDTVLAEFIEICSN